MQAIEKELLFDHLKREGECRVGVGGFCMEPSVYDGAELTLHPAVDIRPGDIIAYFIDARLFAHRVVTVEGGFVRLRADSGTPDLHTISHDAILGKVVHVRNPSIFRRWRKKMMGYLKEPVAG